jgi:hypothetical protein
MNNQRPDPELYAKGLMLEISTSAALAEFERRNVVEQKEFKNI